MSNHEFLVKKELIPYPAEYFALKKRILDEAITALNLPDEEVAKIKDSHMCRMLRDKFLGLFKIGEIVNSILSWNEDVDQDIKEAKKEYLLAEYFAKTKGLDNALSRLVQFLTNPCGNTLFNKMLRIFDNSPPDTELAKHLANALRYIVTNDFEALFEQHRYALGQIDRLTPQALTILADYRSWPEFSPGSYQADGFLITSDWLNEFTKSYAYSKSISASAIVERLRHSINDLISGRYIEAHLTQNGQARCDATRIGKDLFPYILD